MLKAQTLFTRIAKGRSLRNPLAFRFATKNLVLPKIADSIEDVTMMTFLVQEGEYVFEDQEIIEVESHKGTQNIRSTMAGLVNKFLVEEEQIIFIGDAIAELDVDAPAPVVEKKEEVKVEAVSGVKVEQVKKEAKKEVKKEVKKEGKKEVEAPPIVKGSFDLEHRMAHTFLLFLLYLIINIAQGLLADHRCLLYSIVRM